MTQYEVGRKFEWKVRNDLAANGYDVIRAAGSKGATKIDLIALKPEQILFIQAKRTGALPPDEWDRLVEVAAWIGAVPLLAANGVRGQGIAYTRLLAPKRRGCRTQPAQTFLLDELSDGAVAA
jgi:Holliday junction resolvase